MKAENENRKHPGKGQRLYTSVLLALLALVSVAAATAAWFTIADRTRLRSMDMQVTTGSNLRFDLDAHEVFEDYVKTLYFEQIAERIQEEQGFDMQAVPLEPVTTNDYSTFTLEDGTVVQTESGAYLEFTLHFCATKDMVVHLTSASGKNTGDGTSIQSENADLPYAMRISFTVGEDVYIYDPGMGDDSIQEETAKTFGLAEGSKMTYSDHNALFSLKEGVDQPVVVHIWLEGSDERCTDALRGGDYSIRLRFVGTDEENHELDNE